MTLDDSEAVVIEGAVAPCEILFVCEHASRGFPEVFGDLGLSEEVRRSHVACLRVERGGCRSGRL